MKNLKSVLCILLIFILGAASGGLGVHIYYKSCGETYQRFDRKAREEMLLNRLDRRLDLDDRQREQVRALIAETRTEIKNIKNQYRPQMKAVIEKSKAKMRQLLRPDQLEKFEKYMAERKAMHRRDE